MLLNPSIQFFIDAQGVIVDRDERYALRSAGPTSLEFFETAKSLPPWQKFLLKIPGDRAKVMCESPGVARRRMLTAGTD